ncbi:DUF202 domain-containing protein [Glutamicibacter sp.]|uniref:YidH family protein n=1 Tax=Glutamicibacter sp. TaxID=1931995 RepID=UPI0028BDE88F|nr:DUF202 domain-containing protein [Glutamicibacter sp.]
MEEHERGGFARRVLGEGSEPDPRFTLANERTFLAWIRTSLAFLGGGIAIEAFTASAFPTPLRTVLSVVVIAVGALIALGAGIRWIRVERSMRTGKPLPLPGIVPLLSGAAVAGALVVFLMILQDL